MAAGILLASPLDAQLSLVVLGGASVVRVNASPGASPVVTAGKPFALLVYLTCVGTRVSREQLADLLWSDRELPDARHLLRSAHWTLKQKCGSDVFSADALDIGVGARIDSDYHQFLDALARKDYRAAVTRYGGDFLPAFAIPGARQFEMWADLERRRLRAAFVRTATDVARQYLGAARFGDARALATRVRDVEPDAESGWRLLLECLIASREPLHVAIEADALEQRLTIDGREPEPATRALLRVARQAPAVSRTASAALPRLVPETIGRERDFAAALSAWEEVRAGQTRRLVVVSAAGLGKTRLLLDVASRIRASRGRVVLVQASHGDRTIPYAFVSDVAAALAALPGALGVSPQSAATLVALNPTLSSHYSVAPDTVQGDEAARHRTLALTELIGCVASESALALLLDDVHWADDESRHAVRGALERARTTRLFVVAATRPSLTATTDIPDSATLTLAPLTVTGVGDLLTRLGALPESPWSDILASRLHAATDGSPLLIVETLHLLLERNALSLNDDGWTSPDPAVLAETLSAGSAIVRRLQQLGCGDQWLLLLLAASGTPMDEAALAHASAAQAIDVRTSLAQLELRGFAVQGDGAWRVAHDEIADQMLRVATPEGLRAARLAAGHAAVDVEPTTLASLSRALRHFAAAHDEGAGRRTFTRAWTVSRRAGYRLSPDGLARQLLGRDATPREIATLTRAVPLIHRPGVRRFSLVGIAALLMGSGALMGRTLVADRAASGEAELLVMYEDAAHARRIVTVPVSQAALSRVDNIDLTDAAPSAEAGVDEVMAAVDVSADATPGRFLYTKTYRDSGEIDVTIRESDGSTRRLTASPRDDGGATFMPDGHFAAIASARFDAKDHRTQLVLIDLRSLETRRLTFSEGSDQAPLPSPDGTRIAFVRSFADGRPSQLCWVSINAESHECRAGGHVAFVRLLGWRSREEVVVLADSSGEQVALQTLIDGDRSQVLGRANMSLLLSGDSRFGVRRDSAMRYWVAALGQNAHWVELRTPAGARVLRSLWRPLTRPRFVSRVHIEVPEGGIPRGVTLRLQASVTDTAGRDISPGVMRWSSLDPQVAQVDSVGTVRGMLDGSARIVASAGGWRADTAVMLVRAARSHVLLTEDWSTWPSPHFALFGVPTPRRVRTDRGDFALHDNGDGSFPSGVYTRQSWPGSLGLGVEFDLRMPITRTKWQNVTLALTANLSDSVLAAWDRVTDSVEGQGRQLEHAACYLTMPAREGALHARGAQLSDKGAASVQTMDSAIGSDRWVRIRMEIFPDGRCGATLDGRPLARLSAPIALDRPFRLIVQGQSVGTDVLVGPITVWSGVKAGVDWRAIDRRDSAAAMRHP